MKLFLYVSTTLNIARRVRKAERGVKSFSRNDLRHREVGDASSVWSLPPTGLVASERAAHCSIPRASYQETSAQVQGKARWRGRWREGRTRKDVILFRQIIFGNPFLTPCANAPDSPRRCRAGFQRRNANLQEWVLRSAQRAAKQMPSAERSATKTFRRVQRPLLGD